MTVTLTPRAEARLQALAAQRGEAPEAVIETALEALSGQQGAAPPETPASDEAEQTRMRRSWMEMTAQARTLTLEPRAADPGQAPEEAAFGEILTEKFRRQGFNL